MVYYKFFKLFSQLHAVTRRFKRNDDFQCSDKCLSTPYINHVIVNEVMPHLQ